MDYQEYIDNSPNNRLTKKFIAQLLADGFEFIGEGEPNVYWYQRTKYEKIGGKFK